MTFDPYDQWLGIPPAEQPAHYYRLLGLPIFESDAARIQAAADRRMQHVRTFQLGKRLQDSQAILNELSTARVCLLNPESKARYDAALSEWLSARLPVPPPVLPPEAPPLLPGEVRALLPSDARALPADDSEPTNPVARQATVAAAPRTTIAPRARSYTGWMIVGGVLAVTAVTLIVFRTSQRRGRSTLGDAAVALPESSQTGNSDLSGKTVVVPSDVVQQSKQGDVQLDVTRGKVSGTTLRRNGDLTADWRSADDQVQWELLISRPGIFRVEVAYAADASSRGGEARVTISGQPRPLTMLLRDTGGRVKFAQDPLDPMITIEKPGRYTLTISTAQKPGEELMTLRGVQLIRAPVR